MIISWRQKFSAISHSEWIKFGALFLAYFITARLGLSISAVNKFATLIWPPTGIALSFLLLFGRRFWPSVFFAAVLVNFITGAPPLVSLGIGAGNALEALIGFHLCQSRRQGFHLSLDRLEDVITLILRGAIFSTLASPLIGIASLWLGGMLETSQLQSTFLQWWTGDMMGNFIVAPLILTLLSEQKIERFSWTWGKRPGKTILCLAACGFSWLILSGVLHDELSPVLGLRGVYVLIPLLLWVSMRFGQRGATLITAFVSVVGLIYTLKNEGPFSESGLNENILHLVIFLVLIAVTALVIGAVVTERETERRNLELRTRELQDSEINLKQAKEIAEDANAAKSAFLANMSHEIRTPLGAVLGFSEILLQPDVTDAEKLRSADAIRRNGLLLSNIVNDILDLSKVEAGRMEIEKRSVVLSEIMMDFSSLLALEAREKGIRLRVLADGALPNRINTDPLRVRQILLNIVGNAIKFTDQGSVEVTVKLLRTVETPAQLIFKIKDTGRGISPVQTSRLFKPFSQADASTTRKFGGTGLGLVLSRRLAQALGGDVKMTESKLGQGSTFMVTIDPGEIESVSLQTFELPTQTEIPVVPPAESLIDLSGLHVLVVDDSIDNQILITRILRKTHALVDTAQNGKEAVDKAMASPFDIVLMDLQMPEMDGYEATRTLRSRGFKKPIIALTAHAMKDERRKCLENGFDEHVSKPIDRKILLATLATWSPHKSIES